MWPAVVRRCAASERFGLPARGIRLAKPVAQVAVLDVLDDQAVPADEPPAAVLGRGGVRHLGEQLGGAPAPLQLDQDKFPDFEPLGQPQTDALDRKVHHLRGLGGVAVYGLDLAGDDVIASIAYAST